MAAINSARRKRVPPAARATPVTPGEFPLRVFIDGNMLAVPLIQDLASVGLKLGNDKEGHLWLTRCEVRHG